MDQTKQVKDIGWVWDGKIVDPAEERSMSHLDGDEQHFEECELHKN